MDVDYIHCLLIGAENKKKEYNFLLCSYCFFLFYFVIFFFKLGIYLLYHARCHCVNLIMFFPDFGNVLRTNDARCERQCIDECGDALMS